MQSALDGNHADGYIEDRSLDDVTHIVIDEVHERDVETDLTLAVIKRYIADRQARNKPLKVVLMSATIDPVLFQTYFENGEGAKAPVISIPGRSFPVDKHYLEDVLHEVSKENVGSSSGWIFQERSVTEYLSREVGHTALTQLRQPSTIPGIIKSQTDGSSGEDGDLPYPLVALTVAHVLRKSDNGHVLVFLPGWDEIQAVQRMLADRSKFPLWNMDFSDRDKFEVHLLHSTIPVVDQQKVFEPAPKGVPKGHPRHQHRRNLHHYPRCRVRRRRREGQGEALRSGKADVVSRIGLDGDVEFEPKGGSCRSSPSRTLLLAGLSRPVSGNEPLPDGRDEASGPHQRCYARQSAQFPQHGR